MLKQILLSLALLSLPALAQTQPPDCPLQQVVLTSPANLQFDNRSTGCDSWTVYYVADTGATVSLSFQSTNGQTTPGSWVAYTGNTSNSSSSFGTAVVGIATYCGLATCVPSAGVTVETTWVRIHVDTLSGGTLRAYFYGYRTGYAAGLAGGGGGGGGSGCPNPCPILDSQTANSTASWTNATAQNTAVTLTVSQYANVAVSFANTGSIMTGIVTFEASPDGSVWIPVGMAPLGGTGSLATVYSLSTQTVNAFQMYVGGMTQWRVRLSTVITGTGTVSVFAAATAASTEFPQYIAVDAFNRATVIILGNSAFSSEQQAVTGSAVNLGTNSSKSVCVHALIANTINVYAGPSGVTTGTGMEIPPGQGFCWNVSNTNLIYVIASTTGASVSVTWTN